MSAPQPSSKRRKQKARRTKQLADWRAKNEKKEAPAAAEAPKKKAK